MAAEEKNLVSPGRPLTCSGQSCPNWPWSPLVASGRLCPLEVPAPGAEGAGKNFGVWGGNRDFGPFWQVRFF